MATTPTAAAGAVGVGASSASVDKKSGSKLFAVSAYKSLNRKQSYVIALDFKKATVNFHKVKRGKEVKKIFPFTQCVKLEKDKKDGKMLSLTFGSYTDAAYKKTIFFDSLEDREQFCNLVHAAIVVGTKAYSIFNELDVHQKGEITVKELKGALSFDGAAPTKPIDFCQFLLAYASQQTRLGPQVGMTANTSDGKAAASGTSTNGTTSAADKKLAGSKDGANGGSSGGSGGSASAGSGGAAAAGSASGSAGSGSAAAGTQADMVGLRLLEGEAIIIRQQHTSRLDSLPPNCSSSRGTFFLTTYRVMYRDYNAHSKYDMSTEFAVTLLSKVIQTGDSTIKFYCKDYRQLSFGFDASKSWVDGLLKHIQRMAFPKDQTKLFAFSHKLPAHVTNSPVMNGWDLYNPVKEYDRIGLLSTKEFKLVQDLDFKLSPTYPSMFVIPSVISDAELAEICAYRSRGRLPATSWLHPLTGATISRSSQPNKGISGKRCEADEKLIQKLRESNPTNSATLYIMDARPYKAAVGNTVMGKGFEDISHYDKCQLHFMGIANIHGIRQSLDSLMDLCNSESKTYDDATWLPKLHETGWLEYLRLIIQSGARIAHVLDEEGASVLVHCSDGWDRTAQLVSVAEMLLDPYYRTIEGFAVLIEKEWLSFGHKFGERFGHGDPDFAHDQRAPIFIQFIDAIYQIWRQFPLSFEFNEAFLLEIVAQVQTCRFGTFLFDCLRERRERGVRLHTVSMWSVLLSPENRYKYINVFYIPQPERPRITPSSSAKSIVLWERLHMKYDKACSPESLDVGSYLMATRYQQLRQNVIDSGYDINKLDTPLSVSSILLGPNIPLDTPDDRKAVKLSSPLPTPSATGPQRPLVSAPNSFSGIRQNTAPVTATTTNTPSPTGLTVSTSKPANGAAAGGKPNPIAVSAAAAAAKHAHPQSNTPPAAGSSHHGRGSEPNVTSPHTKHGDTNTPTSPGPTLLATDLDSSPDNSPGHSPSSSPRASMDVGVLPVPPMPPMTKSQSTGTVSSTASSSAGSTSTASGGAGSSASASSSSSSSTNNSAAGSTSNGKGNTATSPNGASAAATSPVPPASPSASAGGAFVRVPPPPQLPKLPNAPGTKYSSQTMKLPSNFTPASVASMFGQSGAGFNTSAPGTPVGGGAGGSGKYPPRPAHATSHGRSASPPPPSSSSSPANRGLAPPPPPPRKDSGRKAAEPVTTSSTTPAIVLASTTSSSSSSSSTSSLPAPPMSLFSPDPSS